MVDLDARDAKRAASVDKAFGELFTFTAQAIVNSDVNLPKTVDASKPAFSCVGVWENFSDAVFPAARGSNPDDDVMRRAVGMPSVLVQKALLNWTPARGDQVARTKDGAVYEVAKTLPHDRGRVLVMLSSRKKP